MPICPENSHRENNRFTEYPEIFYGFSAKASGTSVTTFEKLTLQSRRLLPQKIGMCLVLQV
jgi:hypothetical protein